MADYWLGGLIFKDLVFGGQYEEHGVVLVASALHDPISHGNC